MCTVHHVVGEIAVELNTMRILNYKYVMFFWDLLDFGWRDCYRTKYSKVYSIVSTEVFFWDLLNFGWRDCYCTKYYKATAL